MTWEDLVVFLDGAQLTDVLFEAYRDDSVTPSEILRHAPAYLETDRGLLRIADKSHHSGHLRCDVVDAPTFEGHDLSEEEESSRLAVISFGFDYLGTDLGPAACRGLRCAYGTAGPEDGQLLAMTVLADDGEAVTFNPWYWLGLRVTAGDSLDKILATNNFASKIPATIRTWTR